MTRIANKEKISTKGRFRLQITEKGKIVSDTGWRNNQVTDLGFNQYLVSALGSISGSKYISHIAIGTGTVPGAAATSLDGESMSARKAVTAATSSSSKTVRFTATFASTDITAAGNIRNVGLFNSSSTGTLFAGNTFTSSSLATNQAVNATYDIIFA